jgi:hypothetical protein
MTTLIPNENCFIGFIDATPGVGNLAAPTAAEMAAALDLTDFVISITANAQGNVVPTPRLKRLFETSIPGTSTASFTAELYRDNETDTAWDALPRDTPGTFVIARFGGTGPELRPILADIVEMWPVRVTSRAGSAMTSNQAQTFTLTCSVPEEPIEDAVVAA